MQDNLGVHLKVCSGDRLAALLPDLARLRITVFREWPYLYDGDERYEARYLARYAASARAAVIVAFDGDTPVGASTCMPMAEAAASVSAPFTARGWDLRRFCYFGESVLLPAWRGRGIGVAFFAAREAHAASVCASDYACFCAVQRPPDHPARPADARSLDAFWRKRGYLARPDLTCRMSWQDVGERAETPHVLGFWMKSLTGSALP